MCRALSSRASASCRLVQLADSASPSGRYPLSYGLEAFAQHVRLDGSRSTSTLLTLLGDCVRLGVAPSDGVVLACAHARYSRLESAVPISFRRSDKRLTAVKLVRETPRGLAA